MSSPTLKKRRISESSLRDSLLEEGVIKNIEESWLSPLNNSVHLRENDVLILKHPFPVCIINNFIGSTSLLKSVIEELKNVKFYQKSNDLYQFQQSDDVRNLIEYTNIPQLYDLIRTDVLSWVEKVTGNAKLKEEISATFSKYEFRDRLLCHDDKCEDRHIAFILYLVENWEESDGGYLQLFNTDSDLNPSEVVERLKPQFNTLVFFEVTNQSFHNVSEVLSKTKERLSLNGWFHSSAKKSNQIHCKILEDKPSFSNNKIFDLENFFSFNYLDQMNKLDIKSIFSTESEIELEEFLVPKFWDELIKDLWSENLRWIFKKPANIRKYEVADLNFLTVTLQTLKTVFESKSWFKYLKSITGLDFVPSESSNIEIWEKGQIPQCFFEIQKWTPSCYTLIHDQDPEFHNESLDVILRVPFNGEENFKSVNNEDSPEAGHVIYIDADSKDEECLLHVGYKMNSLALIFRDTKTLRFTKYLDSTAKPFYQIFCSYRPWKPPLDQPNLKHCEESSESENSEEDLSESEYAVDEEKS